MSAKRWFIMALCVVLIISSAIVVVNIVIDPFSVFGDKLMNWHSYGMTNNPKAAKFAYIDARIGEFDAFIVGPSGASCFHPAVLEEYTGLRWYNMFNYGADMEYTKRVAEYLLETHRPEMLLLVVPVISGAIYGYPVDDITSHQPLQTFWRVPFMFANPRFSLTKISDRSLQSYVQHGIDVFDAETGTYNKTRRDAEAIGSMEKFLADFPGFVDPGFWLAPLRYIEENALAVEHILALAEKTGTEVIVTTAPVQAREMSYYDRNEVREFYERIAHASGGFWDFTFSAISGDVRFFDDTTHINNSAGRLLLARMFHDDSIYIHDDIGLWVTPENAADIAEMFMSFTPRDYSANETQVPILMYGDVTDEAGAVTPALFLEHMTALYEAGYNAVSLQALNDYVIRGTRLPQRPVVITFDGGYLSAYTHGFPVLEQYDFHAVFFVTGVVFGRDTDPISGNPVCPRFGIHEAKKMVESGLVSIQSNSWSLSLSEGDGTSSRRGVLRMDSESEPDYLRALWDDHAMISGLLRDVTGEEVNAFAYPFGLSDRFSSIVLRNLGITMTFSESPGLNTLVRGLPQSLYEMNRIRVDGSLTGEALIREISQQ